MSPEAWRKPAASAASATSLARSATVIAVAFVLSRALGLVREIILARLFGTSIETSAYVSAFRVPDLLFLIIMAGSFGSAFIPVFAGLMGAGRREDAWRLASTVLNLAGIALAATAALAFAFAEPIVHYLVAPGASPEAQALTTETMRILLLSPVFLGLGIAAKGILEGQDRFDLPAFAPVVYNIGTILGAILLGPTMGIKGVAVGVVAGAIGHVLIQTPGLVRSGMRYSPRIDLGAPGLTDVGRLLGPRLIGQAAFQINFIVVTSLAWRTGEASVSAINYAWQLLMLPHGVLALSISTVIFPTMSRLYQQHDLAGLRATLARAIKPLVFLTLPAAVGLFFFRTAIVQTIFQGGRFSAESTALVTPALAWFAAGLLGYAAVEALTRAFYAMHDTTTPVVTGIAIIILNIAIGVLFVDRFGYVVLAFGLSLTTAIEALALFAVLRLRLGGAGVSEWAWVGKTFLATVAMGLVAAFLGDPVAAATAPGVASRFAQVALFLCALAVSGATYFLAAWLLRLPELRTAFNQIGRKLPGGRRLLGLLNHVG
ncbi:MAG: murein biosynthesis integral membrane protein MurJ [Thermomicrobiales bacterium]|nr:murein biosynthesis integral membrane protein MurJ [Thermomicrobiales bacterium]